MEEPRPAEPPSEIQPSVVVVLGGLFFLSGAIGLILEVLWTRRLTLIFGHTVLAASSVLAAYMSGLGLGSLAGGRWADSAARDGPADFLRRYAWLEAGIGVAALASLPLLALARGAYLQLAREGLSGLPLQAASLIMALLVLLPPTLMMGATLPILTRSLAGFWKVERVLAVMYGLNTVGACLGAALAGYLLLPGLGVTLSVALAATGSLVLSAAAQSVARRVPSRPISVSSLEAFDSPGSPGMGMIPWAMAVAGGASMAWEVGWTRGLVLSLGSSTYAFATILCLFLAGLALGSLAYWRWPGSTSEVTRLGALQIATGFLAAAASSALGLLPYLVWLGTGIFRGSLAATLTLQWFLAGLVLVPPACLLGYAFPLGVGLFRRGGRGRRVAVLYAANTLGCVAGAVVAGFWLLPAWGAQWTLKGASLALIASGLVLGLSSSPAVSRRLGMLAAASLAGLTVLLLPRWNPALMTAGMAIYAENYPGSLGALASIPEPFWYRDGLSSTVSVRCDAEGQLSLQVNGKTDASLRLLDLSTMYLLGYIPSLWVQPRTAAVIGLGAGITVQALAQVPGLERVDCVELEPAVIAALSLWRGYNGRIAEDPRVRVVAADGRTFLESSSRQYDIIVSEPSNVWVAGVGNLYTREFYAACQARLTERGVMAQWFQNYAIGVEELSMVVRTFFDVFPHGSMWISSMGVNDLLLIGSPQPLKMDLAWVRRVAAVPQIRQRLLTLGLASSEAILGHYVCDREAALGLFGTGPLNTDDRPRLEFMAAQQVFRSRQARVGNFSTLASDLSQPFPRGIPFEPALLGPVFEGWISSREGPDLERFFDAHGARLRQQPLSMALARALDPSVTIAQLEEAFRPATRDPSSGPLAAYLLAMQLQAKGAWAAAASWYATASKNPPVGLEAMVWRNWGVCLLQLGDYSQAAAKLQQAAERGGGHETYTLLGDTWLRAHQPARALTFYTKALSENSLYVPALWGRGQAWLTRQQYLLAASAFQEVLDLVPNHVGALTNLAFCQLQQDDVPAAMDSYRQILRYFPNNSAARYNLMTLSQAKPGTRFTPEASPPGAGVSSPQPAP